MKRAALILALCLFAFSAKSQIDSTKVFYVENGHTLTENGEQLYYWIYFTPAPVIKPKAKYIKGIDGKPLRGVDGKIITTLK